MLPFCTTLACSTNSILNPCSWLQVRCTFLKSNEQNSINNNVNNITFTVTGSIVHAFLWVALWLFLTAKTNWDFRLKISIGRTWLKSPSCLALTAQIDFKPHHAASEDQQQSGVSHDCCIHWPIPPQPTNEAFSFFFFFTRSRKVCSLDRAHHPC